MVICFLGDSLTLGVGDERAMGGWVGRLTQASYALDSARSRTLTVYNLGVRGDAAVTLVNRWRGDADRRRRKGEDMAFVFSFGAADGQRKFPRDSTFAAGKAILCEAAALGRTLYVSPPPPLDPAWAADTRRIGAELRVFCATLGVPTTDFFEPLAADAAYMASLATDGIHPDAAGYDKMAALLRAWPPLAELMLL